jgi:hypothetical protein
MFGTQKMLTADFDWGLQLKKHRLAHEDFTGFVAQRLHFILHQVDLLSGSTTPYLEKSLNHAVYVQITHPGFSIRTTSCAAALVMSNRNDEAEQKLNRAGAVHAGVQKLNPSSRPHKIQPSMSQYGPVVSGKLEKCRTTLEGLAAVEAEFKIVCGIIRYQTTVFPTHMAINTVPWYPICNGT